METKCLALKGTIEQVNTTYAIKITIPGKSELLKQLGTYPYHIMSEDETTFTTGPLAYTRHSIHLSISAYQYKAAEIGVYIKLRPNKGDLITVTEIKGNFEFKVPKDEKANLNISFRKSATQPMTDAMNREDLKEYDYWFSNCNCPSYSSELKIFITVTKNNYCTIVADHSTEITKGTEKLKGMIDSKPYFMNRYCSDVTFIIGSSETKFPAHKIILSSRSKYFYTMFNSQMREATEGFVTIQETDVTLFTELFRFIYLDEIEDIKTRAVDLLLLSDKYDVDDLKMLCLDYLIKNITVENALEMYELSNYIGGGDLLKEKAKQIIKWNRNGFTQDMESLKAIHKFPDLSFELLSLQ